LRDGFADRALLHFRGRVILRTMNHGSPWSLDRSLLVVAAALAVLMLGNCAESTSTRGGVIDRCEGGAALPPPSSTAITGYNPADGVFDPAPTSDECGRVWMSYSAVDNSTSGQRLVHIRIAQGSAPGWTDANANVTTSEEYTANPIGPLYGTWQHEVSRLFYDFHTSDPNQRWKLIWHRYRWEQATVGSVGSPLFQHGWISFKTAPNATGPWSAERKLFVGSAYDTSNNSIIGSPEYHLDTLHPALSGCLVFTEPGMLATLNGVYISLKCATGAGGAGNVVLLRCDNQISAGSCGYRGTLLTGPEAANYNDTFGVGASNFTGFSATELVNSGSGNYLLVTPTEGDLYRGCLAFEIVSLDDATLVRDGSNVAIARQSVRGTAGSFNGACGQSVGTLGILYSELFPGQPPQFRIFGSRLSF